MSRQALIGATMLYVSQARAEVECLADHALWMEAGRLLT
jgi:ABC-type molybdate transport system ATPase subunit